MKTNIQLVASQNAALVAARRAELEAAMDAECLKIHTTEKSARKNLGTNASNVMTLGRGHRTIGAKTHGAASIGLAGSGTGSWKAERLHRMARSA